MSLSLPPNVQKMIDDRVKSGRYRTPEDVVAAAVTHLEQSEQIGEFDADASTIDGRWEQSHDGGRTWALDFAITYRR